MLQENGSENLSILISGRIYQQVQILKLTKKVINLFTNQIPTVFYFMDENVYKKVLQSFPSSSFKIFKKNEHAALVDYVITIGGDGTILYAAKQFQKVSPPFLTFQKGTLGFLCKFSIQQLQKVINRVIMDKKKSFDVENKQQYTSSNLMRLTAVVTKSKSQSKQRIICQKKVVLNEVAITRKNCNRIILQIYVNQQFLTTTSGDGILISTPTGSTAYALSAGGPVVLNGVNSIILVPIAPNSLSFRPICFPSSSKITIKLSSKSRQNCLLNFDGQSSFQMTFGDQIQIKHEIGQHANDLILYEFKNLQNQNNANNLPTWMTRLKLFLGWNQVFKSQTCPNPRYKQLRKQNTTFQKEQEHQNSGKKGI